MTNFKNEMNNAMMVSNVLMNVPAYAELMKNIKCYSIENGIEYDNYLGSLKTIILNDNNGTNNIEMLEDSIVIKLVDKVFTSIIIFNSSEGFWLYDSYINLCISPNKFTFELFLKNLDIYINKEN